MGSKWTSTRRPVCWQITFSVANLIENFQNAVMATAMEMPGHTSWGMCRRQPESVACLSVVMGSL